MERSLGGYRSCIARRNIVKLIVQLNAVYSYEPTAQNVLASAPNDICHEKILQRQDPAWRVSEVVLPNVDLTTYDERSSEYWCPMHPVSIQRP